MSALINIQSGASHTHLIVGGSGILGYSLALRISSSEVSKVFVLARSKLPIYFKDHTRAIHIPFTDHSYESIRSILCELNPSAIWFLLSDSNNSETASIASSIRTNLSYPTLWLSALADSSSSARFIYASSVLSGAPASSCYSATKSAMTSFLTNPIVTERINSAIFFPTPLIGPGERRSTRLLPSILNSLTADTKFPKISLDLNLTYSYSLNLASALLDYYQSRSTLNLIPEDYPKYTLSAYQFTESIKEAIAFLAPLSKNEMLTEYSYQILVSTKYDWQSAVRMAVMHRLLYK
jgi:nucleoside-diphosphate-sugar epimerase